LQQTYGDRALSSDSGHIKLTTRSSPVETMKKQRVVPAAEFKTRCLAVMDDVEATGEEITITKHGRPVARLVPVVRAYEPTFGRLKGWVTSEGDIISPIDDIWEANAD
jgi:prevent-host-death family protein